MPNRVFFLATLLLPVLVGYLGYFVPALDRIYFIRQFAAITSFITAGVLALYQHARARTSRRWARYSRNWNPITIVTLNP